MASLLLVAAVACGGGPSSGSDAPVTIVTPLADLCAGAAPRYSNDTERLEECPFIQQADNITTFGRKLGAPAALTDASGAHVATVTHTCDVWTIGTDADGVVVVVSGTTGQVVSHGNIHPGMVTTKLPAHVPTPLATH